MGFKNWIFITLIYGCSIILIIDGLSITNDRESRKLFGGYKITPKFCNASRTLPPNDPRVHGPTICMFNHECTQRHGEVVGACMDGFLFGTCCQLHGSVETPLRPTTFKYSTSPKPAAAIIYEQYGGQQTSISNSNTGGGYYGNQNDDDLNESNPSQASISSNNTGGGYYGNQNDDDLNETNPSYSVSYDDTPPYNDNDSDLSIEEHSAPSSSFGQKNDVFLSTPKPTIFIPDDFDNLSSYFPISTTPSSPITKGEMYLPPSSNAQQTFTVELPSLLSQYGNDGDDFIQSDNKVSTEPPLQHDFTAAGISHITNILTNDNLFSHSDITHPGPDSVLVESNGQDASLYGLIPPSSTASHLLPTSEKSGDSSDETTTPRVVKITYPKPQFKPRPTTSTEKPNKYILVHTISNDKQPTEIPAKPEATISENDIESIETIIWQLNGTQQGGPQYETLTEKTGEQGSSRPSSTYLYTSVTPSYGSTSFYVTNKLPGSELIAGAANGYYPSTNYVLTPTTPTRRPIISDGDDRFTLISSTTNSIKLPSSTLQPPSDNTVTGRPTILISTSTSGVANNNNNNNKPSTSYIFSSTPITRKPTTTKTTLSTFADDVVVTPTTKPSKKPVTKRPTRPTTIKTTTKTQTTNQVKISTSRPPSTSYVSSSVQPPKKPITTTFASTTEKPSTVILIGNYGNDYVSSTQRPVDNNSANGGFVQISTITDGPHNPTIHITPKPTVNLVTQTSSWDNRPTVNQYTVTGQPESGSSYIYQRPGIHFSTTPNYPPISNDFDDPGYFGVTVRPTIEHSVSTTAIYHNVVPQDAILNSYGQPINGGSSTYYRPNFGSTYGEPVYQSTPSYPAFNGQNELHNSSPSYPSFNSQNPDAQPSSPSDLNDFPPDRNPNIPIRNPTPETTTPAFTEDNMLDDKMNILVNKIVASLQDNFEGLADLLYERNETMIDIEDLPDRTTAAPAKPSVITKKPVTVSTVAGSSSAKPTGTKKPVTKKPATSKPLSDSVVSSPVSSVGTKRPTTATTLKPASSQAPTKKPVTKISTKPPVTTKKPVKPQTSQSTVVGTVTTKKPVRIGTSTKRPTTKPTRRVTTSQTTSTTEAIEYEEGEEEEEIGQEVENQEENSSEASSRILCGVRPQMKSGRIVGGKSAEFGEWPWQVLVRESTWLGLFTKNKCGGVLISNNYVITAAHCQPGFLASLVAVFGEYDISGELESKRSVTKNVKNVIVHRNYDAATFENDLALLELESPVYYDTHIVPICMPADEAEFTGRMATVSGWGRLKYGGGVPSVLQVVKVPILQNNVCQEMFNAAGHNKVILSSFLCAGYANGQKDSCEGDSGGPLVLQRPDGRWELAGTVSHGIKCAAPYLPGVYMRTTFYKPWFESVTGVH